MKPTVYRFGISSKEGSLHSAVRANRQVVEALRQTIRRSYLVSRASSNRKESANNFVQSRQKVFRTVRLHHELKAPSGSVSDIPALLLCSVNTQRRYLGPLNKRIG